MIQTNAAQCCLVETPYASTYSIDAATWRIKVKRRGIAEGLEGYEDFYDEVPLFRPVLKYPVRRRGG